MKANEDTVESQETVGTCCGCESLGCLDTDPNKQGGGRVNTCSCSPQTCVNTCFHSCYEPDCYGSKPGEVTCAQATVCDISCTGVYPTCC